MSLAFKLGDKKSYNTERVPQYRLATVLICIGLAFAIARAVFTPAAIGHVGGDQIFLVGGL
jgi:hypothetical protein